MSRFPSGRPVLRRWAIWTLGFVSFPIAGIAALTVAGPIAGPGAAALGGAVSGLVIGAGQALAARGRLDPRRWIPATAAGMSAGLLLGATTAGFATTLPALVVMGAITGAALGAAQALALPPGAHRWVWAAALPALWALGWTATAVIGVDVERQYATFGAAGAVTVSALSGLLLEVVLRRRRPGATRPTPASSTLAVAA